MKANVARRKRDYNGNPIGIANAKPVTDTREYELEFEDGTSEFYTANMIAENMYSQIDSEGEPFKLISEIIDHRTDARALTMEHLQTEVASLNQE